MDEELEDELNYLCTLANDLIHRLGEYNIPYEFCEYISDMVADNGYCDIEDYKEKYMNSEE